MIRELLTDLVTVLACLILGGLVVFSVAIVLVGGTPDRDREWD